jgi:hypothetical protein
MTEVVNVLRGRELAQSELSNELFAPASPPEKALDGSVPASGYSKPYAAPITAFESEGSVA